MTRILIAGMIIIVVLAGILFAGQPTNVLQLGQKTTPSPVVSQTPPNQTPAPQVRFATIHFSQGAPTRTPPPASSDKKIQCEQGGGTWREYPTTCHDECVDPDERVPCGEANTYGCDCGPNKCWNLTQCI